MKHVLHIKFLDEKQIEGLERRFMDNLCMS